MEDLLALTWQEKKSGASHWVFLALKEERCCGLFRLINLSVCFPAHNAYDLTCVELGRRYISQDGSPEDNRMDRNISQTPRGKNSQFWHQVVNMWG